MRRLIGLAIIGSALFMSGPAQAVEEATCPFTVIVNRSRDGSDGQLNGTIYGQDFNIRIFRGSKWMKLQILSAEDQYHQRVKAIPSKTSLRVFLGELEIDVVARRAGSEPKELSYEYSCQPAA